MTLGSFWPRTNRATVHGDADFSGLPVALVNYFRKKVDSLRATDALEQVRTNSLSNGYPGDYLINCQNNSEPCPGHTDGKHIEDMYGNCMGFGCSFRFRPAPNT